MFVVYDLTIYVPYYPRLKVKIFLYTDNEQKIKSDKKSSQSAYTKYSRKYLQLNNN